MSFHIGDTIDNRFRVSRELADTGGMGKVLIVADTTNSLSGDLALKYCKQNDPETTTRFRREVRIMTSFHGNSRVAEIYHSNIDYSPPYFVMKYYPGGDLTNQVEFIRSDPNNTEFAFNAMIDCISELHSRDIYHRDIKPQNFLIGDSGVVVSDLGLGTEINSSTRFTDSNTAWGTHGYLPPEFQDGGFKYADAISDIFMLGRTFYALLTGRDPIYINQAGIYPALYVVVARACDQNRERRYASLPELRQALAMAFDVILGRGGVTGKVNQLLDNIKSRLRLENKYDPNQVIEFINSLPLADLADQIRICYELDQAFMLIIGQDTLARHALTFLNVYRNMVEDAQYSWSFAETIAENMKILFNSRDVPVETRVQALDIAIVAAEKMNRFAAMDTCVAMISSVSDEVFGAQVAAVMQDHPHRFIESIEPSQCKSDSVRRFLYALKNRV